MQRRKFIKSGLVTAAALTLSPSLSGLVQGSTFRNDNYGNEYKLLNSLPEGVIPPLMFSKPDENGFIDYHKQQGQWYQAGYQRGGARHLLGGVMAGDLEIMEEGWKTVEVTFEHQIEDGGFLSLQRPFGGPPDFDSRVETAYFYIQAFAQAILVLKDSPYEPHFRDRIEKLKPKLKKAADFIVSGFDGIIEKVSHTANRLFIAAKALGLSGVILEEQQYKDSCFELVDVALTLRDEEGVFIESGGRDSSYNAVSILFAQAILVHLPHPPLEGAIKEAMIWQETMIKPTGEVSVAGNTRTGLGQETSYGQGSKNVNYREVAVAFYYHAAMYDRSDLIPVAAKVAEWV